MSSRIAVWPGDVPFALARTMSLEGGDAVAVGAIHTTLHVGAHADAPAHFAGDGPTIEALALEPYLGPCQVIRVAVAPGARIFPRDLAEPITAPRVLFRSDSFVDAERFDRGFASLSPAVLEHLHALGVTLVGIDTPSIDPVDSKALESHHTLLRLGMRNLEGLMLSHVEPGLYTLVALPLRLEGADASPVRAILLPGAEALR